MEKVLIVQTTFSDKNEAVLFARKVLQSRLAACVQLSRDIESMYWWKDEIEQDTEILVTMKTLQKVYPELETFIEKNHTYEAPEIVAIPAEYVGTGYYKWLCDEIVKEKQSNE